jgi:protein-S-isoprenylcysteine O-methyltransferase Ste14
MDQATRPGARTWFVKQIIFVLVFGAVLFISAGRFSWLGGWAYLGALPTRVIANALTLKPDLLAERSTRQEGSKNWDLLLATAMVLWGPILTLVTGGLDARNTWSSPLTLTTGIIAWVVGVLGVLLTVWAMASNEFFSGLVRIQADRGHTVATGGPYRYVRHPGYVGAIAFDLAVPLFLGSLWAFIPAGLTVLLIIVGTALEDVTLQAELDGYRDYAQRVRYRLLPGVW